MKQVKIFRDWTTDVEDDINNFCKSHDVIDIKICYQDSLHCAFVVIYEEKTCQQ